jgi:L-alanine-DL-glutamate epimerase-like enolase superfamily enzyme
MIESSLAITAAAHLAPLVDYVDLDGSTLIRNDPFQGMQFNSGRFIMPKNSGIGTKPSNPKP